MGERIMDSQPQLPNNQLILEPLNASQLYFNLYHNPHKHLTIGGEAGDKAGIHRYSDLLLHHSLGSMSYFIFSPDTHTLTRQVCISPSFLARLIVPVINLQGCGRQSEFITRVNKVMVGNIVFWVYTLSPLF